MKIDVHVHISAVTPGRGKMSDRILRSLPFRFMRWALEMGEINESSDARIEEILIRTIRGTPELNAAVVLAFDAVYERDGSRNDSETHLFVENDYVIGLARKHREVLFGASVHPYRKDAIAELERCVNAGAVLVKWLPITQKIDPSDPRCFEFYDAMAHHRIPLLSHTGWEKTLPNLNRLADPALLAPAIRRGVTVIAAHCGTRSSPFESDFSDTFFRMALEHEHFYGDTSALNLPTRMHAYRRLLEDDRLRAKVVHGSDWPIVALPPVHRIGLETSLQLFEEKNWMRRDVLIKQHLGFDDDYFRRAARLLRLPLSRGV